MTLGSYRKIRNLKKDQDRNMISPTLCLSPESYEVYLQAGLLARPAPAAFPFHYHWKSGEGMPELFIGLTAAGTAPDFHRIPY